MKRLIAALLLFTSLGLFLPGTPVRAAEPFFFIQLTDPQFGMFTGDREFAQETANFEFAVATVNRLRPAFVVITGDLVNKPGDPSQIAEYQRILARLDPAIPVYNLAGNHDVENVPTPETIAAYTNIFGPDYFTFEQNGLFGIVLNSVLIHSPKHTAELLEAQDRWLKAQLETAREKGARHIVVFQHHPWFLKTADEPDEYFNIPRERRSRYLALFREFGVKYLFCGHYHRNALARDQGFEVITTGPVGKPLGNDGSGLRLAIVKDDGIEHRYHDFGQLPNSVVVSEGKVEVR
jgi:serine/threonine-protein phosphatase CPPED1